MNYKSLELRVGFTIFMAALILILGIMWFHEFKIGHKTCEFQAVFPMVGGVDPGDEVNVNGVEKGKVKSVSLRERDVLVTMEIDADTRIPEDSEVILQAIGIMGERVVTIILGESETFLEPGATIKGLYDPGISEALASTGRLMEDLKALISEMREIAEVMTEGENLSKSIENLAAITADLRGLVNKSAPELEEGASSFRRSAARVDDIIERNSQRVDSIIVSLDTASRELPVLFDRIENVVAILSDLSKSLESDESTMGALFQNRELLDRLEKAITGLDELVTDIRANPGRYFKVEIF
ncbi:MAG: MCE family protein [Candidatus Krumholzibacteria bacterium]|nr:MCE family protein [Candidatus Krumholzibacteria bacterium]